jgi:DNA-binding response OmpR family regulator
LILFLFFTIGVTLARLRHALEDMPLKRILVVDDDAAILRLLAIILRREHYDVDTAGGGKAALAKIELSQYNVIVLDLMMPDVSGFDVLTRLNTRFPQVKCVVILSAGSSLEIARLTNPNVFAALRKPFDITDLITAVRGCIDAVGDPVSAVLQPVGAAA